jgi:hypothetical protein
MDVSAAPGRAEADLLRLVEGPARVRERTLPTPGTWLDRAHRDPVDALTCPVVRPPAALRPGGSLAGRRRSTSALRVVANAHVVGVLTSAPHPPARSGGCADLDHPSGL